MTPKMCYVIMPFSETASCTQEEWTRVFEDLIKPAVEEAGLGYVCRRSEATTGSIIRHIVEHLYDSDVVVADVTDRNANVFYELGVRHALKNRTIIIAQKREHIPSDLYGYANHVYDWRTEDGHTDLRDKMRQLLEHIEKGPDRPDNPVSDFLGDRRGVVYRFQLEENSRKLRALFAELYYLGKRFRMYEEGAATGLPMPGPHTAAPAIDHFLATQYVYNSQLHHQLSRFRQFIALADDAAARPDAESVAFLQDVRKLASILWLNALALYADHQAGNDTAKTRLEPFPQDLARRG